MYSPFSFALAQQLVEVPYLVGQTVVYAAMVYW